MVWGMIMPTGFGEVWPDGDFVGWNETLQAYYREKMPPEQKALFEFGSGNGASSYAYYVSGKFISPPGETAGPEYPPYSPIEPQEPPKSFTTEKRYSSLGSLIMLNGRILAVDDPLKAIIERLEPDVHQFFPIEIRMPHGTVFPKSYFVIHIGQYHKSFSSENSREGVWRENGEFGYIIEKSKKGVVGLAFAKSVFGNSHLWRERDLRESLTCFSDQLQAEISKAGLRIPKHYRMLEI